MEFLATFGLVTKELFDYNRESFQFDADQRLERELLRLDMQVSRFELFREDIRDLVELTVGKMEMYHLVGALFLEKTVALYCEGRLKFEDPPFLLACYFLSVAGGFACLVLCVWLSMYASICSHSFGVRLLTRYVRLPIPGEEQLGALNARLGDFEAQGNNMVHVPFTVDRQDWERRQVLQNIPEGEADGSGSGVALHFRQVQEDLLGKGEMPLGPADQIMKSTANMPGKHVQLYRRLQNKWQCYDAYTRVCMAIGINQILLALTFYLINVTLIQYSAPSACYACIIVFQFTALALTYIDIAKLGHFTILTMQSLQFAATIIAAVEVTLADKADEGNVPAADVKYYFSGLCFFFIAIWFEMILYAAWPSRDESCLPRRFRAVLFLDVFQDADLDVRVVEGQMPTAWDSGPGGAQSHLKPLLTAKMAREADDALFHAHCGLRRWEAVPSGVSASQRSELAKLRGELNIWREALNAEAAERATKRGVQDAFLLLDLDDRPWNELSEQEQGDDPHAETLVGPFKHSGAAEYYFSLESNQFIYRVLEGTVVLTLRDLAEKINASEEQVRTLLGNHAGDSSYSSGFVREDTVLGSDEDSDDWNINRRGSVREIADRGVGCWRNFRRMRSRPTGPYVAPRLPWRILHLFLRALQVAWFFVGVMCTVEAFGGVRFDVQSYVPGAEEREGEGERRRLSAFGSFHFQGLEANHPQGDLFEPQSLSCLPSVGGVRQLLVGTRHEMFWASAVDASPEIQVAPEAPPRPRGLRFEALPAGGFPPDAVALCGAGHGEAAPALGVGFGFDQLSSSLLQQSPCLLAALAKNGTAVALWAIGAAREDAHLVPIVGGSAWQKLAGAIVPCSKVKQLLPREGQEAAVEHEEREEQWDKQVDPAADGRCLLAVGWDGWRVPVAALALGSSGGGGALELRGVQGFHPAFDLPLRRPPFAAALLAVDPALRQLTPVALAVHEKRGGALAAQSLLEKAAAAAALVDLHVDAGTGQVWALSADGALQAWDLQQPRSLGRWSPMGIGSFQARAMCAAVDGQVHIVGRRAGGAARAKWVRATLPVGSHG